MIQSYTEWVAVEVMFCTCIWEVLGLVISQDIAYPNQDFHDFSSVLRQILRQYVTYTKTISFQIPSSASTILPTDAIKARY
jgi:hypothetical protein